MVTNRAICTVAAFMQGAPIPPPGMAQEIIAALYCDSFINNRVNRLARLIAENSHYGAYGVNNHAIN